MIRVELVLYIHIYIYIFVWWIACLFELRDGIE